MNRKKRKYTGGTLKRRRREKGQLCHVAQFQGCQIYLIGAEEHGALFSPRII